MNGMDTIRGRQSAPASFQDIILENEFEEMERMIKNEMVEVENLYTDTRRHLQDFVGTREGARRRLGTAAGQSSRSGNVFISDQTSNLVSMKSLRLQQVKALVALRDSRLNRDLRVITEIRKAKDAEGGGRDVPASTIVQYLIRNVNVRLPITGGSDAIIEGNFTKDIDAALLEALGNDDSFEEETTTSTDIVRSGIHEDDYEPMPPAVPREPVAALVLVDELAERVMLATADYEIIRELSVEEVLVEDDGEGGMYDATTGLPVELI
jgi:hypothetical protein